MSEVHEQAPLGRSFPMFPLSGVFFPFDELHLNVFEERYQRLVIDCRSGANEFGIVLIARGSEVGGGDQRFSVGTVAKIEIASPYSAGRWFLSVRADRRLRVRSWLGEDPYPLAEVEDVPEAPWNASLGTLEAVEASVRRAVDLLAELNGVSSPPRPVRGEDLNEFLWRLAASAPLNPIDAQKVLETEDPLERAELLATFTDSLYEDLRRLNDERS